MHEAKRLLLLRKTKSWIPVYQVGDGAKGRGILEGRDNESRNSLDQLFDRVLLEREKNDVLPISLPCTPICMQYESLKKLVTPDASTNHNKCVTGFLPPYRSLDFMPEDAEMLNVI